MLRSLSKILLAVGDVGGRSGMGAGGGTDGFIIPGGALGIGAGVPPSPNGKRLVGMGAGRGYSMSLRLLKMSLMSLKAGRAGRRLVGPLILRAAALRLVAPAVALSRGACPSFNAPR